MAKTVILIDGFNLYHAINVKKYCTYKWLNLAKLATCYVTKQDSIEGIYYFTALATWAPDKERRHRTYIRALKAHNVEVVFGEFKRKDKFCTKCRQYYRTFEEKQTDVNIAIYLLRLAIQDKYEKAIIISGDSDLIPSIDAVQKTFPTKKIGVVIPIGRASESLKNVADFHMKMKEKHLQTSQFPPSIPIENGQSLQRPRLWQ